jgi:hypothetical protein
MVLEIFHTVAYDIQYHVPSAFVEEESQTIRWTKEMDLIAKVNFAGFDETNSKEHLVSIGHRLRMS